MTGYLTHVVGSGDSLQRLAHVYGVEDWRDIVRINELVNPYIDDAVPPISSYTGKVAKVGDSILIPYNYDTPLSAKVRKSIEVEEQAYGIDFDIFTYGDNNVQYLDGQGQLSDNGFGDIKLSGGVPNLRQRLIIRLLVNKGEFILYPEFGSRLSYLTGLPNTEDTRVKIQVEIQKAVLSDSLVAYIENLKTERFQGGVNFSCDVYPVPPYQPFQLTESLVIQQ